MRTPDSPAGRLARGVDPSPGSEERPASPVPVHRPEPRSEEPPSPPRGRLPRDRPEPVPSPAGTRHPLSHGQEALWFLERLAPGSPAYIIAVAARFPEGLDPAALRRGFELLIERHPVLRTTYGEGEDGPFQRIHSSGALPEGWFHPEDASPWDQAEFRERLARHAFRPFDLERGPVFRATLLRGGKRGDVLLLALHHIAGDLWSVGVLWNELGILCEQEGPPGLAPLPLVYTDFVHWQRRRMAGAEGERLWQGWRERLEGAPLQLNVPADRPRPAVQSFRGGTRTFVLDPREVERLGRLAEEAGGTLFAVLLAAWSALLGRLSGQDDLLVGVPTPGRSTPALFGLLGYFVNPLVMRCELAGDPSFRKIVRRARRTSVAAFRSQELPFPLLAQRLAPSRDPSRPPVFQTMFSLQRTPRGAPETLGALGMELDGVGIFLGSRRGESVAFPRPGVQFDLSLLAVEIGGPVALSLEYNGDLWDGASAERILGHLRTLLLGAAADPETPLADLPLLSEAESEQILREWNATSTSYPREATVGELFAAQARKTPEAVALAGGGCELTYAELEAWANRLAGHLRQLGVVPEVPVGMGLERSVDAVVAQLAIYKAGGVYVPLDPSSPEERLLFLVEDSGVAVLLTSSRLAERFAGVPVPLVLLDREAGPLSETSPAPEPLAGPDNLAYVMYTSGSTGRPKGVAVTHRGIVRLIKETDYAGFGADEVFLQLAPLAFDAATFEVWAPLLNGGRLEVFPAHTPTLKELAAYLRERRVTTLWLTAGLFHQIAEAHPEGLASLRWLLAGGDVLSPAHVAKTLAVLQGTLINGYGPTEGTTFTCCHPVPRSEAGSGPIPIGRPIANTRTYILDRGLRPVPPGVPGELLVGGDGLARGYHGRPDLTAERFVPDHVSGEPGARLYRTGDLARHRADGTIEFLGRLDDQAKIRGFRVEPGEVEAVLAQHPAVRQAAVVVRLDPAGGRRLVAYVVLAGEETVRVLREDLRRKLPDYMVPAAFVELPSLPLTANGKVDRRALPEPERVAKDEEYEAPRTPTEGRLAGIWAELLGVELVGAQDDFFDLGGHSLLATRVASRVRADLGVEIPLRVLFEAPTVAALAVRIEEARTAAEPPGLPLLVRASREGDLPLSYTQERLWFLDQLEPGSAAYNLPAALCLAGNLDAAALERSLGEILRRHEALRTIFPAASDGCGEPRQVVAPAGAFRLPRVDFSGLGGQARAAAERLAAEEADRPFDLASGPLFRPVLLRVAPEEHLLLLAMHHIISDGWSLGVLRRELVTLYSAFAAGQPPWLPELPVQAADHAVWQRRHLAGSALAAGLAWWRERLRDLPERLDLPADRPRPAVQSFRGALVVQPLPAPLVGPLRELASRRRATPFLFFLASFQALLARTAGVDDLAVGFPAAGRDVPEVEDLIGCFVKTLVLRGDLRGDPEFAALLDLVRREAFEVLVRQDVPFEKLVQELRPERALDRSPLFQVMFSYENGVLREPLKAAGLRLSPVAVERRAAQFDLTLTVEEEGGGWLASWEYARDLFDAATIARFGARFRGLLAGIAVDPARPVSCLPLLPDAERHQILAEWNNASPAGAPRPLHELVEARADADPDAPAVLAAEERLTYGELERRANQLARHLLRIGVAPEERVGVCLDRLPSAIVALLAVLKAGAAFLPLDSAHPRERLAGLLRDAGARWVLTREELAGQLSTAGVRLVLLEREGPALARESGCRLVQAVAPEALAYVIYTSGSTGEPKGVGVSHAAAAAHVAAVAREHGLGPADRVLWFSSPGLDVSLEQILPALAAGAAVVPREGDLWNPEDLAGALRRLGITVADLPAAYWEPWVRGAAERSGPLPAGALRLVTVGGEAMSLEAARRWPSVWEPADGVPGLVNAYGPTEAVVTATQFRAWPDGGRLRAASSVPIGRLLPHRTAYVLDARGELAPVGVPAELCLGGLLARGYLGRPDLTAARFVPDPWSALPGGRLYRTGDLARRLADGSLEFLGRLDHQVKIRGFRVETGEVEAALAAHPGVRQAVVVSREVPSGGEGKRPAGTALVAYVVLASEGAEAAPSALRSWLRDRLPEPMVPAHILPLPALPLTPAGKVDRAALPEPERPADRVDAAPRGPVEQALALIWREVLGIEMAGRHDHFFELGGHSLLATQVASRVRRLLDVDLPVREIFEAPVLAELARRIQRSLAPAAGAPPPLVARPRTGEIEVAPLSFSQQRLWLLEQLDPGSAAYAMPIALRLKDALAAAALTRAVGEVVRRQGSLHTIFEMHDGGPVQVVAAAGGSRGAILPAVDLSSLEREEAEAEALRLIEQDARRPFDLARGPLFRPALLRLDPDHHVLLASMHHIVSDGWSVEVLLRELGTLYGAFRAGRPSPLPPPALQYTDFAAWQRGWLQGPVLEGQLSYWRSQLAGAPPALDLPLERPRPAVQRHRGGAESRFLAPELADRLRRLGRRQGTTLFMTLLAALQALLGRVTGQTDVVVGAPVAGRDREETEGLIGFFLNTLALRTSLAGDPRFAEILERVREVTLGAYAHQDLPFELLLDELRPERDLSRSPLFQVVLNWLGFGRPGDGPAGLPGMALEPVAAGEIRAKFDLELYAEERGAGLALTLVYDRDLFAAARIRELADHLEALIAEVADHPERHLSELALAVVRRRALRSAAPPAGSLTDRFEEQAALHPDRIAVRTLRGAWTYAELRAAAHRAACGLLAARGPGEERIALLFAPGEAMVAAVLGALAAGKTYVPLDPSWPRERLRRILEDAEAGALLTVGPLRPLAAELGGGGPAVLDLEAFPPAPAGWEPPRVPPETLAYLLYTSGSLGLPKGVMQSHRNVLHHAGTYAGRLGIGPEDRVTLLPSYAFDAAVMDLFGALLSGAELCIWDLKEDGFAGLAGWIGERRITIYHSTPTVFRTFLQSLGPGDRRHLASVRCVVLGGEEVRRRDVEIFRETFPRDCVLVNGLGPTESTLALQFFLGPEDELSPHGVPVGHPVAETEVSLWTPTGEQVAVWGTGEIVVRSPYLALGYWRRPDLTAAAFQADPEDPERRSYRTGDLGRRLPDGGIEFLGRRDLQVKIRGVRVEPAEVESVLARHPAVGAVAVAARPDPAGETCLVAWVEPRADAPAAEALRAWVAAALPDAMVPAAFVVLASLPLTPTGKVDRRALPAPDWGSVAAAVRHRRARTPTEEIVAGVWADLLGLPADRVAGSFFQLGGSSLTGTQVVSRLRAVFGVELPLRVLFEHPTVAGLAAEIDRRRSGERAGEAPPIAALLEERGGPAPLSFAQERLWRRRRQEATVPSTLPSALRLSGRLDIPALARSLREVVQRHEVLRTTFAEVSGRAVQLVRAGAEVRLPVVDLCALPAAAREQEALRLAVLDARTPFDLERGSVLRTTLFRLDEGEHLLLCVVHHIAFDGWSGALFAGELSALYGAFRAGLAPPLPPLPVQVQDFARWQRRRVSGPALEEGLDWWRSLLRGAVPLRLGGVRRRSFRAAQEWIEVPAPLARDLRAFAAREGATPFMVLLTAFQLALSRETGETDVTVMSLFANRQPAEIEPLIGNFFARLPLRVRLGRCATARELLRQVREVVLGALAHADVPYERVLKELNAGGGGRLPGSPVTFALQDVPVEEGEMPGLRLAAVPMETGRIRQDLSLFLYPQGDALPGRIKYDTGLFGPSDAARLRDGFLRGLRILVHQPDSPLERGTGGLLRSQNETTTLTHGARALDPRCERGIRGFLELKGSTTFYLERLGGREIHVSVLGQRTVGQDGAGEIHRESVLHPAGGRDPILHSVCRLRSDKLTRREIEMVLAGGTPLAKIFDPVDNGRLRKANGTLRHGVDDYAARRLRTTSRICYSRTFELVLDGEVVGTISETLNEESMARAFR